jgi:CheY-like chemotaxis protein
VHNVPAIAITSYAGEQFKLRAIEAGFQDYISKPVTRHSLVNTVGAVLVRCGRFR